MKCGNEKYLSIFAKVRILLFNHRIFLYWCLSIGASMAVYLVCFVHYVGRQEGRPSIISVGESSRWTANLSFEEQFTVNWESLFLFLSYFSVVFFVVGFVLSLPAYWCLVETSDQRSSPGEARRPMWGDGDDRGAASPVIRSSGGGRAGSTPGSRQPFGRRLRAMVARDRKWLALSLFIAFLFHVFPFGFSLLVPIDDYRWAFETRHRAVSEDAIAAWLDWAYGAVFSIGTVLSVSMWPLWLTLTYPLHHQWLLNRQRELLQR